MAARSVVIDVFEGFRMVPEESNPLDRSTMNHSHLRYFLPAILVAALGGYFAGRESTKSGSGEVSESKKEASTLRAKFLSSDEDVVDYEKLARVCLSVVDRGGAGSANSKGSVKRAALADPDDPAVLESKGRLDDVVSNSLEKGVWSRGAGVGTRGHLKRLPPSDAADFEKLLRTMVERGDLKVQPGAWIPDAIN